jgi:hypothetical protein
VSTVNTTTDIFTTSIGTPFSERDRVSQAGIRAGAERPYGSLAPC